MGASVNLLAFTIYKRPGLAEVKPTKIVPQLADKSTRIPRGVVEDVLIKVREFIFFVNFVLIKVEDPYGHRKT